MNCPGHRIDADGNLRQWNPSPGRIPHCETSDCGYSRPWHRPEAPSPPVRIFDDEDVEVGPVVLRAGS